MLQDDPRERSARASRTCIEAVNAGYDLPLDDATDARGDASASSPRRTTCARERARFSRSAPPKFTGSDDAVSADARRGASCAPRSSFATFAISRASSSRRRPRASSSSARTARGRRTCSRRSTTCSSFARRAARAIRISCASAQTAFTSRATVETDARHEIGVGFERAGKRKRVRLDGAEPERLSDALGALPVGDVLAGATSSSSRARRARGAVSRHRARAHVARVSRRAAALPRARSRGATPRCASARAASRRATASVAVWEPALAEHGAVLWRERARVGRERSRRSSSESVRRDRRDAAACAMRYASVARRERGDRGRARSRAALEEKRALDMRRGLTHVGPASRRSRRSRSTDASCARSDRRASSAPRRSRCGCSRRRRSRERRGARAAVSARRSVRRARRAPLVAHSRAARTQQGLRADDSRRAARERHSGGLTRLERWRDRRGRDQPRRRAGASA